MFKTVNQEISDINHGHLTENRPTNQQRFYDALLGKRTISNDELYKEAQLNIGENGGINPHKKIYINETARVPTKEEIALYTKPFPSAFPAWDSNKEVHHQQAVKISRN